MESEEEPSPSELEYEESVQFRVISFKKKSQK